MISNARKILTYRQYKSGEGTHHYDVKYTGEWEDWELINAVDTGKTDNPTREELTGNFNYGGYVERIYETEDVKRARVGVYYD